MLITCMSTVFSLDVLEFVYKSEASGNFTSVWNSLDRLYTHVLDSWTKLTMSDITDGEIYLCVTQSI